MFFVSESFIYTVSVKVIKVTLVIHKVNMFSEKYPVEIKLISCHGDKNVKKTEKIADLNDFKSY